MASTSKNQQNIPMHLNCVANSIANAPPPMQYYRCLPTALTKYTSELDPGILISYLLLKTRTSQKISTKISHFSTNLFRFCN